MFTGLGLLAATLVLRGAAAKNHHIRSRLLVSAGVFAVYTGVAVFLRFGTVDAELQAQLGTVQPLLLLFGLATLVVALVINPWREDRIPDRFPNIVQDAIIFFLFAVAAAVIMIRMSPSERFWNVRKSSPR